MLGNFAGAVPAIVFRASPKCAGTTGRAFTLQKSIASRRWSLELAVGTLDRDLATRRAARLLEWDRAGDRSIAEPRQETRARHGRTHNAGAVGARR